MGNINPQPRTCLDPDTPVILLKETRNITVQTTVASHLDQIVTVTAFVFPIVSELATYPNSG